VLLLGIAVPLWAKNVQQFPDAKAGLSVYWKRDQNLKDGHVASDMPQINFNLSDRPLIPLPTQDAKQIRRAAGECLTRVPLERRIRLLGVRVGALPNAGRQGWRGEGFEVLVGTGTLMVLLLASRFGFSQGWLNVGATFRRMLKARAEIQYALAQSQWLAMEGERGQSRQ